MRDSDLTLAEINALADRPVTQEQIEKSFSCDTICNGKIRRAIGFNGTAWVATGGVYMPDEPRRYCLVEVVPLDKFDGEVTTYHDKGKRDNYAGAREDPNGFYYGMLVRRGKVEYALGHYLGWKGHANACDCGMYEAFEECDCPPTPVKQEFLVWKGGGRNGNNGQTDGAEQGSLFELTAGETA